MSSRYQEAFSKLEQNPSGIFDEAVRLLCKIGDNILKNPLNSKIRILQKTNTTISNKILSVKGGKECLTVMGFEEKDTYFVMSNNVPLKNIEEFIKTAESWKKSVQQICTSSKRNSHQEPGTSKKNINNNSVNKNDKDKIIKKINLPPLQLTYTNPFLRIVETYSHGVLQYEDKDLQERTRKLIPILSLEENAQKRLRVVQEHIKKNKLKDMELAIQDMLILELLNWFKEEFFSWVDSPTCEFCGQSCVFSHMSTDPKLLVYTDRVELHRCNSCHKFTPFPRYNDLNILLETRRGRCGEWANVFTLCCRAMGWDSRYVVDQGDHVWTEVYSTAQKRWLHCDSCENICDTPLVYESGWKKNVSYIMAYSAEEVQDVTWRYSSHHKDVLKRRTACSEEELLGAILKLTSNLQQKLSPARKSYLLNRHLMELVEFLTEKKVNADECHGRTSGSEIWRLARGETQESPNQSQYVWKINPEDIIGNSVTIRYSSALNKYECISDTRKIKELVGWETGTFEFNEVFRKEEKDWKMVYLTRREGKEKGDLSWKFDLRNSKRTLDTVSVQADQQTYETGIVNVKICSNETCVILPKSQTSYSSNDFSGLNELTITATLSGGKGDTSWQHAQLFRQSLDSTNFNFSVTFTFQ